MPAVQRILDLTERLQGAGDVVLAHADAGVGDGDRHLTAIGDLGVQ